MTFVIHRVLAIVGPRSEGRRDLIVCDLIVCTLSRKITTREQRNSIERAKPRPYVYPIDDGVVGCARQPGICERVCVGERDVAGLCRRFNAGIGSKFLQQAFARSGSE